MGESINDWYLTLRQPKAEGTGTGYAHFHTLFDIGCKYGRGASDSELINGVWQHFKSKTVARSDGTPLAYYKTWKFIDGSTSLFTNELLQKKEGQCNAWTRFFLDVLKAQGYMENGFLLIVKPDPTGHNRQSSGFLLGQWTFKEGMTLGEEEFDYWNVYDYGNKYLLSNGYWGHVWWQDPVVPLPQVEQTGYVPAQNNPDNSLSYFGQHIIVRIIFDNVEKYLDPSYGEEYDFNLTKMDSYIAGFWFELFDYSIPTFVNPPPSNNYNDVVLFRKNTLLEKLAIVNELQH